jgi:hypothetical protein
MDFQSLLGQDAMSIYMAEMIDEKVGSQYQEEQYISSQQTFPSSAPTKLQQQTTTPITMLPPPIEATSSGKNTLWSQPKTTDEKASTIKKMLTSPHPLRNLGLPRSWKSTHAGYSDLSPKSSFLNMDRDRSAQAYGRC